MSVRVSICSQHPAPRSGPTRYPLAGHSVSPAPPRGDTLSKNSRLQVCIEGAGRCHAARCVRKRVSE
eukprot:3067099-Pyramimonas_sp.AAC.1